jgi:hypothetical protein
VLGPQAGRGCTLLIHEATFEPALRHEADRKRHSTVDDALQAAEARRRRPAAQRATLHGRGSFAAPRIFARPPLRTSCHSWTPAWGCGALAGIYSPGSG